MATTTDFSPKDAILRRFYTRRNEYVLWLEVYLKAFGKSATAALPISPQGAYQTPYQLTEFQSQQVVHWTFELEQYIDRIKSDMHQKLGIQPQQYRTQPGGTARVLYSQLLSETAIAQQRSRSIQLMHEIDEADEEVL